MTTRKSSVRSDGTVRKPRKTAVRTRGATPRVSAPSVEMDAALLLSRLERIERKLDSLHQKFDTTGDRKRALLLRSLSLMKPKTTPVLLPSR